MSDSEKPKKERDWLSIVIDAGAIAIIILVVTLVGGLVYWMFKIMGIF